MKFLTNTTTAMLNQLHYITVESRLKQQFSSAALHVKAATFLEFENNKIVTCLRKILKFYQDITIVNHVKFFVLV